MVLRVEFWDLVHEARKDQLPLEAAASLWPVSHGALG
jgi:hypothetical protein